MDFPKITVGKQKILIISPICDQIEKIEKLRELKDKYIMIFLGEVCYPWDNIDEVQHRIEIMNEFLKSTSSFYVLGDGDFTFKNKNKNNSNLINDWINKQCLGINITFNSNNSLLTVVHGGIPPESKDWSDIINNMEIAFVKNIKNKPWHESYDGRFGFIVSAHPTSDEIKIFDFSASIDVQGKVYAQEYSESGFETTILL